MYEQLITPSSFQNHTFLHHPCKTKIGGNRTETLGSSARASKDGKKACQLSLHLPKGAIPDWTVHSPFIQQKGPGLVGAKANETFGSHSSTMTGALYFTCPVLYVAQLRLPYIYRGQNNASAAGS